MADQLNLGLEEPAPYEPKKNILEKAGDFIKERYGDKSLLERGADVGEYLLRATPLGIPASIIREAVQKPKEGETTIDRIKNLIPRAVGRSAGDTAAQIYSTLNEIGMGGPEALVKAFSGLTKSSAYDKLKEFKKKHQEATDRGSIAGVVAGMMAPSGGILKAASGGAKALGAGKVAAGLAKAADIASGAAKVGKGANILSRAGGAALRGGLAGAEQAIPRGIIQAVESGDIGKAAKGAGIGTLLGAGIGGGASLLGSGLSKLARTAGLINKGESAAVPLSEKLTDIELASRGINTKDFRRAIGASAGSMGLDRTGTAVNQAEKIKRSALDLLKKNDILNADEAQAFIQGTGKKFEELNAKFDALKIKPSEAFTDEIMGRPEIQEFLTQHGDEGKAVIDDLFAKLDRSKGVGNIKNVLQKVIKNANKSTENPLLQDSGDVAHAIRDVLDDKILQLDPNYVQYKADWKNLQPLRQWVARDKITIGKPIPVGSDTAAKTAFMNMMGGAGVGGTIGATAAAKEFDPNDPSTWGPAAAKVAGGIAGGAVLNRLVPAALNRGAGDIASLINRPGVAKAIGGLESLAGKAAPKLAELAPKVAGAAPSILERAAEAEPAIKEALDPEGQDAQEAKASAQASEAAVTPEAAQEAKDEVKTAWAEKVEDNIRTAFYQYGIADRGYSYEDFLGAVREVTNDFDPTIAAEIVFSDKAERAAFLKDYDKALQYKALDVGQALDKSPIFFGPTGEQKASREALTDYIARVAGEDPMLMDAKKKKKIADTVKDIAGMKGSAADKQSALLRQLQANYGINYKQLADLGLLGVV